MDTRRALRLFARAARWLVVAIGAIGAALVVAFGVVQTGWGRNLLRALIVRQANQYLDATLSIAELRGSLVGGVVLRGVRLARGADTLVSIDEVALTYRIRELFDRGTTIRELRLVSPRIVARGPSTALRRAASSMRCSCRRASDGSADSPRAVSTSPAA